MRNLYQSVLFKGMEDVHAQEIIEDIEVIYRFYRKGESIPGRAGPEQAVGLLLEGSIHAMKYLSGGGAVLLRAIPEGDFFGVGSVFQEKDVRLSFLEAHRPAKVAFIDEHSLIQLLQHPQVLRNYLRLINDRIRYLNHKIDLISQTSIRERLLLYFQDCQRMQGQISPIHLEMTKAALAEYLGIGRGSLYRVLSELEAEGLIHVSGRTVSLFDV